MKQASDTQASRNFFECQPGVPLLRGVMTAIQRLWPALAARVAYRLICTPMPFRTLRARAAENGDWTVERLPFEDGEVAVYTSTANPSGLRPVLLMHGWGGSAFDMLGIANELALRGLTPVLVDMPAHGICRGSVTNLAQFVRAIEYLSARQKLGGTAWTAIVAHSLGACAVAFAAARRLQARKLVFLAPAASPIEFTRLFAKVCGLSERTRAWVQRRMEAREGMLMRDFEPAAVGPHIPSPTLIVHDRGDRISSFAGGEAYRDHIPRAAFLATEGLGHRKILNDENVILAVGDFVAGEDSARVKSSATEGTAGVAELFGEREFTYLPNIDEYECPAGHRACFRFSRDDAGLQVRTYWSSECPACPMKQQCTTSDHRHIRRWELLIACDA